MRAKLENEIREVFESAHHEKDGDYKDYAREAYNALLAHQESGNASRAFKSWMKKCPDGRCLPRMFMEDADIWRMLFF